MLICLMFGHIVRHSQNRAEDSTSRLFNSLCVVPSSGSMQECNIFPQKKLWQELRAILGKSVERNTIIRCTQTSK